MAWNLFRNKEDIHEVVSSTVHDAVNEALEKRMADLSVKVEPSTGYGNIATAIGGHVPTYRSTGLAAFFACINLISNSIASLPINVKFEREIIGDHPIHSLFYHGAMSKYNFMKQMIWDLLMYGESVAYIKRVNGKPVELTYCEHGAYSVIYNQLSQELYYQIPFLSKSKAMPKDVLHFVMLSENGYQGKSVRFYADKVLELSKATDQSAINYYSSGCAVKGVLTIKGARKGAKESARASFEQLHGGPNAKSLVILDDDMSYQALSSNANDTQMLDSRMFNVVEICRFFNINPVLIGDLSKSSYNSVEQAQLSFITQTLMPYISMIEHEFTRKLISESEHGFTVDLDERTLLRGDMAATSNYIKNLVSIGVISINEARDILGLSHIENGDKHIVPFSDVSQNTIEDSGDIEDNINQDQ